MCNEEARSFPEPQLEKVRSGGKPAFLTMRLLRQWRNQLGVGKVGLPPLLIAPIFVCVISWIVPLLQKSKDDPRNHTN
ncbi:MAG: hypothetical protein QOK48_2854 [Blastocatellia bacterium]|jgi:hypothetical protein|nr:hypothetical protein [Blastocatellia bacterium]